MSIPKVVMSKLYGTSRWEANLTYFLLAAQISLLHINFKS